MGYGPFSTPPVEGGGGGGGVSGLTSADGGTAIADNAIIRGDGTDGIQGSTALIQDTGHFVLPDHSGSQMGINALYGRLNIKNTADSAYTAVAASGFEESAKNVQLDAQGVTLRSDRGVSFTSGASDGTRDTAIARVSASVMAVTNGTYPATTISGLGSLYANRVVAAEITSPETIAVTDSRKVITNEGASGSVTYNLPTAAAGLEVIFIVHTAQNMVVTANTSDTIRIAAGVSSAAGTATNGTIGGVLHLVCLNATEWFAISSTGTWTLA